MKPFLFLFILLPTSVILSAQSRYDIVISELMADPSPVVGLPNNEWIELTNTTASPINLLGCRIADEGGQSGQLPNFILEPDSSVIICSSSAVPALSAFGKTINVTSFPSLDNDGETIYLKSAMGMVLHAINYTSAWYQNELKKEGGWSLEMIDTKNPCGGMNNWKASIDAKGGTPGQPNSVKGENQDHTSPKLINVYPVNDSTIVIRFDEPLDSSSASLASHYSIDKGIIIKSAAAVSPLFHKIEIVFTASLQDNVSYSLTINGITDCKGNSVENSARKFGLQEEASAGDIVINEILFNPKPTGYDYVEFYNTRTKLLDASKLYVANRNSSGAISSITRLSDEPILIFPGDYIAFTTDTASLLQNYIVQNPRAVFVLASLPSWPDDNGTVILLNSQGEVMDEINYDADWHFDLLSNDEGVSLERIDPNGASQQEQNWGSAASTAGYGTPGYKNSQFKNIQPAITTIEIIPKTFSPDGDGYDDIATIQYKLSEPGYVANITIFDAQGRAVKSLVRNQTLSTNGYWNWNGLGDKNQRLPVGNYVVFTEIFNLQGKKQQFKNVVVLARKM